MNLRYEVLPLEKLHLIQPLCDALMAYQKEQATIHPEWFDGMSYETRMIPAVKAALENHLLVAWDGDNLVGYAYSNICQKTIYSGGFATLAPVDFFDFSTVTGETVGCLSQFYLTPSYRGSGIGGKLFDQSMTWLKTFTEIEDIFIFVSNGNDTAFEFYKHKGFRHSHDILEGFIHVLRN